MAAVAVSLSQMLHFCDISGLFLIFHLPKQTSGNTLARSVFKELEHCVVFILVFVYCYMLEGKKTLDLIIVELTGILSVSRS